eukprot:501223-Amphidinium_carterae.1
MAQLKHSHIGGTHLQTLPMQHGSGDATCQTITGPKSGRTDSALTAPAQGDRLRATDSPPKHASLQGPCRGGSLKSFGMSVCTDCFIGATSK